MRILYETINILVGELTSSSLNMDFGSVFTGKMTLFRLFCIRFKNFWNVIFMMFFSLSASAEIPILTCEPRILSGVPGEPLQAELTIEIKRATPIQLHIPSISNLVLRVVEKVPIQRTKDGRFVQKRIIIWQGVEAGNITLTNMMIQVDSTRHLFPALQITVEAVEAAKPPQQDEMIMQIKEET